MIYELGKKWFVIATSFLLFFSFVLPFYWNPFSLTLFIILFLFWFVLTRHFWISTRVIQARDNEILSAVDGKVIRIDQVRPKEYIKSRCWLVSTYCSWFDGHVNRIPSDGVVKFLKYVPGKFNSAKFKNTSFENEQMLTGIQKKHYKLLVSQVAGKWTRKIICRLRREGAINKGDVFGFVLFPCRVDLYLPLSAKVRVKEGDKVKSGFTVIGELRR